MGDFKNFFFEKFELLFVILLLIAISTLIHFIPHKIPFLDLYYIPVLLASFYLGTYQSIIIAVCCSTIVGGYIYLYPELFFIYPQSIHSLDSILQLTVWSIFLILGGIVIGKLNARLEEKIADAIVMDNELDVKNSLLEQTTERLLNYNNEMQARVNEKTKLLENSKKSLESHKAKIEQTLYSTMDAAVVKLIIEKRLRVEKRRICLLFSDLEGFTAYAEERGAEIVITDLNAYLQEMEQVVLEYSAHIDKYIGDAVMCEFGAPTHHEHHSLLAVSAGYKMQQKMKSSRYPWKMRIGIATGETIIGLIGGNKRQSYSALGDTVNLASRIEGLCTAGKVAIGHETYLQIKGYFDVQQKNIHSFKNNEEDIELVTKIKLLTEKVNQNPSDFRLLTQLCHLFLKAHDYEKALTFTDEIAKNYPSNKDIKLLRADILLETKKVQNIHVKGRKKSIQIYEIVGLKNVLLARSDITDSIYRQYMPTIEKMCPFPEDLILPVECQDGSIGHARTVGFFSYVLADLLKLPEQEKYDILKAAYFADFGKTIIPHHVLNRHGTLSKEEFNIITKHNYESVRKLKKLGYESKAVFNIILCHHENIDGNGYPAGLKNKQIPLGAKIVAVADAYSALTAWRPYREKWNHRAALTQLKEDANNGKFDIKLIQCLETFVTSTNAKILESD